MAWPFSTGSPSFFSQRASCPSVMSKPKEGMITLVATGASFTAVRSAKLRAVLLELYAEIFIERREITPPSP
jgi:hypothetical protein